MRIPKFISSATALLLILGAATPALAGKPYLDAGLALDQADPYKSAQEIPDITGNRAIYGKLEGDTPVDIYSFTAKEDSEQTFGLMIRSAEVRELSEPTLIFIDPTDATTARELGIPLPGEEGLYHSAVINPTEAGRTYNEPVLFEQYRLVAEQVIQLQKDTTYYLIVLDPGQLANQYVIRLGADKAWSFGDFFTSFGDWWKVKLGIYGASTPFEMPVEAVGLILFWFGFAALLGVWIIQSIFGLLANKQRAAAYLLVKMQAYSRVVIWVSLWFILVGGYIAARSSSFTGILFLLTLIFDYLLIVMLVTTFKLAPRLMALEVSKKEAVLSAQDNRLFMILFVLGSIGLLAMLVFAVQLLVA